MNNCFDLWKLLAGPGLLTSAHEYELIAEELSDLKDKPDGFHHELSCSIYKKMSKIHLASLDMSTLFNANKEIQTSENALINAQQLL